MKENHFLEKNPDKVAIALAMGADLVNISRGFMISVGCIMAQVCHNNTCPVGVATTNQKLQDGLDVEEKHYRVCNYVISLHEGLYNLAAAAGIDSPVKFERKHIVFKDEFGRIYPVKEILHTADKVQFSGTRLKEGKAIYIKNKVYGFILTPAE
jgi:hypothetical protein